jgi:hypothetical protein
VRYCESTDIKNGEKQVAKTTKSLGAHWKSRPKSWWLKGLLKFMERRGLNG